MGVVFLARHPEQGPAALKFVRAAGTAGHDESFRARFGREIEAARRVRSPRAARVLAADPDAIVPWLATAFVDGPTLQEAIDESGPMSGERLVSLAVALADALASVHEAGVVHRDLKPRNILLTADTPVVIDFGIASVREAPQLTRTGVALGTPGWMAPEQVQGRPCGPEADVFGWGAVVAFAAGGKAPFGEGSADALLYRIVHEPPAVPPLPPALDGLVQAALEKRPDRRPAVARAAGRAHRRDDRRHAGRRHRARSDPGRPHCRRSDDRGPRLGRRGAAHPSRRPRSRRADRRRRRAAAPARAGRRPRRAGCRHPRVRGRVLVRR